MPPKKQSKKEAIAKPDNSGIPKNDIQFKFEFFLKVAPDIQNYAIMFQWFGQTSDKIERFDTGFIQSWTKKADRKYHNNEGPQYLCFQKQFDPIRVQDDFCKTLCTKQFYIYIVDGETMKVKQQILLDYSSLLMKRGQKPQTFSYKNDKILVMEIEEFNINIIANKQLIGQIYRNYLNPFQIEVIGVKDIPDESAKNYLPTYVKYQFFDGTIIKTHQLVGKNKLTWQHKHVFLVGLLDPDVLKQKLRTTYLRFQLHDRDELVKNTFKQDIPIMDVTKIIAEQMQKEKPVEQDPKKKGSKKEAKKQMKQPEKKQVKKDAKKQAKKKEAKLGQPIKQQKKISTITSNYGVAAYFLVDFLNPNTRTFKLKSHVVPRKTFQDIQSKNIDLNTTARSEMQKVIVSNNYFENDTILNVGFSLSFPISKFIKPEITVVDIPVEEPKKGGKKQTKKESIRPPSPPKIEQKSKLNITTSTIVPEKKDIYERIIYFFPYKKPELVKTIQQIFYSANLKAMKLPADAIKQLTTYVLKPEQKLDRTLDIITGIQILDNDFRMYILEGLKDGAMKIFGEKIPKDQLNSKTFKILKNTNIGFLQRLYIDFNLDIKRIRLRPNLTELLLQPSIYIKSKVPQQVSITLNHINDIKRIADNLKKVDSMNMWPDAKHLIQVERKFSDSITFQDIYGIQQVKKQKKKSSPDKDRISTKKEQSSLPKLSVKNQTIRTLPDGTLKGNMSLPPENKTLHKTYLKSTFNQVQAYNLQMKHAQIPPHQEVFMYAGQSKNYYQQKMRQLRQKIKADKNNVYTYGQNQLTLSIDPVNLDDKRKLDIQLQKTKLSEKPKFSSLIIKTKQQRMLLPKKPNQQTIKQMRDHPYHEQKKHQKQNLKNLRGMPLGSQNQFKSYIGKIDVFSQPEIYQSEKISPAQKQRLLKEQKKLQAEQQKKKFKGDPYIYIKKQYLGERPAQLDKYKSILQGSPSKKGLILPQGKSKTNKTGIVGQQPISAFIHDQFNAFINPLVRVDHPQLSLVNHQFNNFQNPQFLTKTSIHKPLKKANYE